MKILITGASGNLARAITAALKAKDIEPICYSHSQSLADVDWQNIETVINCAAVIPGPSATTEAYYDGNVSFVEKLLPYCRDKHFVHFSTFSELFRADDYQRSKMLGNSVLLNNTHWLASLNILPLPTLEDDMLIGRIVAEAEAGDCPEVNRLRYNFMSFDEVAEHVVNGLLSGQIKPISEAYREKVLYDEVAKVVGEDQIKPGPEVDRTLKQDGLFLTDPALLTCLKGA